MYNNIFIYSIAIQYYMNNTGVFMPGWHSG